MPDNAGGEVDRCARMRHPAAVLDKATPAPAIDHAYVRLQDSPGGAGEIRSVAQLVATHLPHPFWVASEAGTG